MSRIWAHLLATLESNDLELDFDGSRPTEWNLFHFLEGIFIKKPMPIKDENMLQGNLSKQNDVRHSKKKKGSVTRQFLANQMIDRISTLPYQTDRAEKTPIPWSVDQAGFDHWAQRAPVDQAGFDHWAQQTQHWTQHIPWYRGPSSQCIRANKFSNQAMSVACPEKFGKS